MNRPLGRDSPVNVCTQDIVFQVRLLYQYGASVESTDGEGRSALAIAAKFGYPDMAAVLLDCGADIDRRITGG